MKILTFEFKPNEQIIDNSWLENKKLDVENKINTNNIKISYNQNQYTIIVNDHETEIKNSQTIITDYCSIKISVEERLDLSLSNASPLENISQDNLRLFHVSNLKKSSSYLPHPLTIQDGLNFLYKGSLPIQPINTEFIESQLLKHTDMFDQTLSNQEKHKDEEKISIDLLYLFIKNISKVKNIMFKKQKFKALKLKNKKNFISKFSVLLTLFLLGCQSIPSDIIKINLSAATDINPDINNQASPVVIIMYQLKNKSKFEKASYFDLYNNADTVLESNLLSQNEYEIRPGETILKDLEFVPESRYLGIMIAFRDFNRAEWKKILKLNEQQMQEVQLYLKNLDVTLKF